MGKVIHTCTNCVPIDASIIEAYVALVSTNKAITEAEELRVAAEEARVEAENEREERAVADHTTATTDHTRAESDHSRAESDHSRAESDHTTATSDHTRAETDHTRAESDHTRAETDHTRAESDHTTFTSDHTVAESDHGRAESDHSRAESDHTTATSDHTVAESDHSRAESDHSRAETDHSRAESDHYAIAVKADKVVGATAGNLAILDENGNISDPGLSPDYLAKVDGMYDTLVSGASKNLVGRGSVPALFTLRTTGGNADVGSGTAQIKKLYGNSIVWNQQMKINPESVTYTKNGVTLTDNRDGSYTIQTEAGGATADSFFALQGSNAFINIISGHKYYLKLKEVETSGLALIENNIITDFQLTVTSKVATATNGGNQTFAVKVSAGAVITTPITVRPMLFDLTLGNFGDITTPAEFETLYWLKYYAFNPGAIKNTTSIGIKTTGFNQWDEVAELGGINAQGQNVAYDDRLRAKNYIPAFPETTYFFKTKSGLVAGDVFFYDANKTFISAQFSKGNKTFITPSNCHYIRIALTASYGNTYNNDVCINLSWSGYRNGEYEPYWERTINLPFTTMTGKLNGEGESVVIAPDGWMSAGDARFVGIIENGMLTKVEKHVAQVDLGTLAWSAATSTETVQRFIAPLTGAKSVAFTYDVANLLSSRFVTKSIQSLNAGNGGDIGQYSTNVYCSATLGTYADADAFKAAMNGVKLNYELATPEVYVLDEPINMNYSEDDFGTEERLPADTADNVSAPIFFDVQYPMNAVDMLRRLGVNYIKKESMVNFLEALKSAGVISAYTMTYNSTNDDYNFTITPPTE